MFEFECSICGKHAIQRYRYYQGGSLICNDCHRELLKKRPDIFCIECGKLIMTSRVYKNKKGEPICRTCQLNQIYTDHYGSREEYSRIMQENRRKTLQSRYGEDITHPMQLEEVKEKVRQTNLERYGDVHNWGKNSTLRDGVTAKIREVQNSPDVKAKRKATNTEKYGGPSPFSSSEVRDKYQNTMLERYGVDHNWCNGELRNKIHQEFMKSHSGYTHWTQLPEVKEKVVKTSLERYGVENVNQSPEIKTRSAEARKVIRNSPEHLKKRIDFAVQNRNLEYVSVHEREDREVIVKYRCRTCGTEFEWCQIVDPRHPYCPKCSSSGKSIQEAEIKRFLMDIGIPEGSEGLIMHNRSILHGKELDFYLPSHHLAIEFDGIYWHNGVDNSYKFEECKKNGIRLIRITEYDWWQRREKIQSLLKSALGIYDVKLGARKCIVRPISIDEYRGFMGDYHLQGYAPASVKLGLFYNDKLIQVEGYGTYRYSEKDSAPEWELIRECSLPGYQVFGGKSKIQSYFIENYSPTSILSYCHKDKFSGKSYEACGYKLITETPPGYSYYRNGNEYSRIVFQKYKMKSLVGTLLDSFDPELTEFENMDLNGYSRMYDYGNYVYIWEANNV